MLEPFQIPRFVAVQLTAVSVSMVFHGAADRLTVFYTVRFKVHHRANRTELWPLTRYTVGENRRKFTAKQPPNLYGSLMRVCTESRRSLPRCLDLTHQMLLPFAVHWLGEHSEVYPNAGVVSRFNVGCDVDNSVASTPCGMAPV